ncbi:pullulanase X25 domain-containing protein, partial [Pseudarthrobacter oxydans]|uniref:pullulanase X25 domain-containing protein n=1 Tax=Pseudarthrobacter oxydans TaxID=1671 RepID=UPI00344221DA
MIQQVSMRGRRRNALISAAIGTSISAALAGTALPAIAAHTQLPSSVTLVGSLQDELGCAGEWQADCAATRLQSVPGTEGLYQATFDIPAGSYEVKTALNDSWT